MAMTLAAPTIRSSAIYLWTADQARKIHACSRKPNIIKLLTKSTQTPWHAQFCMMAQIALPCTVNQEQAMFMILSK
jgi:hypothetical protein